jgi:hypothetical protein
MKTSSWFTMLPSDHMRIGISRGQPRGQAAGYRMYRKLAPGPWFNSAGPEEYYHLYKTEILAPLNPQVVLGDLVELSLGKVPVLLCFERPNGRDWCHRAMAADWLSNELGFPVPEFGCEHFDQKNHPLMPKALRRAD